MSNFDQAFDFLDPNKKVATMIAMRKPDEIWLFVERPDGSKRGFAKVTPLGGAINKADKTITLSFGTFTILGVSREEGALFVRQTSDFELWNVTEAPEFRGVIDMMAA